MLTTLDLFKKFMWGENICTFKNIITQENTLNSYYIENISKKLVLGATNNGAVTEQILDTSEGKLLKILGSIKE